MRGAPLNDFISTIRNAETPQDEKFFIKTEKAYIRADLKSSDNSHLPTIMLKLLFLDILGEDTSWGQVYAANLMAAKHYSWKIVGYLCVSQILTESEDLSVLITQTLLYDLQNNDPKFQCLALSYIANNASTEICNSVATAVQKVINETSNRTVMKKAAMALTHIMRKVPELIESCKNCFQKLLNCNDHGVILAGSSAVETALSLEPRMRSVWKIFKAPFIQILTSLTRTKPPQEYAYGITYDPFLQCKVMRILVLLKTKSADLEKLLQEIISTTDPRKNAQRAVLYQAVETIVSLISNSSLRGLAFNQVGRLLTSRDTNVLHSALSVFNRVLYQNDGKTFTRGTADSIALQRYKKQIVKCLDNSDPSIRRVALSVILALIDETNVKSFVPEILQYLKLADGDFRAELVNRLYFATIRFCKDDVLWVFDTVIQIVKESGNYFGSELITAFTQFVLHNIHLIKDHALTLLTQSLIDSNDNQSLIQISSFILGEIAVQLDDIKEHMKTLLQIPQTKADTKMFLIMSLAKIAARMNDKKDVIELLDQLTQSNDIEIQQRAGELSRVLQLGAISEIILAPMENEESTEIPQNEKIQKNVNPQEDILLQISQPNTQNQSQKSQTSAQNPDLLLSMLVDTPKDQSTTSSQQTQDVLLDFSPQNQKLNALTNQQAVQPVPQIVIQRPPNSFEVMEKQDFVIFGQTAKNPNNANQTALMLTVISKSTKQLPDFHIEMRVGPGWQMLVKDPSSTTLMPNPGQITQMAYINAGATPFALNVVVSYRFGSQPVREVGMLKSLP